ncbi:Protein Mdm4 [Liparis tanakae]|uniref:Protein Mdm4 n=1 Tax=Liparis tanakae TaxID=230148 RepID=A0A4Z2GAQ0_9TELE|nr:Protein Mdm4 [Liparis tanakae]
MSSLSAQLPALISTACRTLPGDGNQVQPKAPLLQILRVAGAQEEVFTLKEVMHYLGQYIMGKQLYDKQRQHIVHCQDDPLGELLEVESFSVRNPRYVELRSKQALRLALMDLSCKPLPSDDLGRQMMEEDTAIVSDTTDDLWFLTEGGSEQVSVEMKEAALEEGSIGEGEALPEDYDERGKEEKADREVSGYP